MIDESRDLYLPSDEEIQKWNDIEEDPITSTAPRAIPEIQLFEVPPQDNYDNFPRITRNLQSSTVFTFISLTEQITSRIEKHIFYIYQLRSKTRGLENEIKSKNIPQETYSPKAKVMLDEMTDSLKKLQEDCIHTSNQIAAIFSHSDFYEKGYYSSELIDQLCNLIFLLLSLGFLCPTRNALSDDLSVLQSLTSTKGLGNFNTDFISIRQWICNSNSIRNLILNDFEKIANMNFQTAKKVVFIFWNHIKSSTAEEKFIYASQEAAYVTTLMLLIDHYAKKRGDEEANLKHQLKDKDLKKLKKETLPNEIFDYIKKMRSLHPALILYNDCNVRFDEMFHSSLISEKVGQLNRPVFNLNGMVNDLKAMLTTFSNDFSALITPEKPSDEVISTVIKSIPIALRKISKSIYTLNEFILDKHNHAKEIDAPKDDGNLNGQPNNESSRIPKSNFELAMKYGITQDREAILQILSICRSFRELINDELPKLTEIFSKYIQDRVQDFSRNSITRALEKSKCIADELHMIQDVISYDFAAPTSGQPNASNEKYKFKCSPHISFLLLLRSQLQIFLNPESLAMNKGFGKKSIDGTDINNFEKFLNESTFYIEILQLQKVLSKACDQSSLYFKESYLDLYRSQLKDNKSVHKIIYFPITASLPYTLINFILDYGITNQVMLGSLFYPLSIYDDAASSAVYNLKSKYLYEEIVTECQICILTIVKLITDTAFHNVEEACVKNFVNKYNFEENSVSSGASPGKYLSKNNITKIELSQVIGTPYRIAKILQQDRLFIIGQQFDVKSAISKRLSELFIESIKSAFNLICDFGLAAIPVFVRSLDVIRNIHEVFASEGHYIDSIDILIQTVIKTYAPNSFNSDILIAVFQYTSEKLIPKFIFSSCPSRFFAPYGSDLEQKAGKALKERKFIPLPLKQTISFMTVDHIKEFFSLIDDGSTDVFINMMKTSVDPFFQDFCDKYRQINILIKRIADTPIGTGCHKAYEQFEGAYRSLTSDKQIDDLFSSMKILGNLVCFTFMCDIALFLNRSQKDQVLAYLTEASYVKENGSKHETEYISDMIFDLFEQEQSEESVFKRSKKFFNTKNNHNLARVAPEQTEITYPFLQSLVNRLVVLVEKEKDLFDEKSTNLLNFSTLNGFAAVWSVLEFVFCLKEVYKHDNGNRFLSTSKVEGPFATLGEGVLSTAALILCLTGQIPLFKILSIGTRIIQQKKIDLAALNEEHLNKFLNVFQLVNASIENSITLLIPTIEKSNV